MFQMDSQFQNYCNKALSKISDENLKKCLKIKNGMERITFIASLINDSTPIKLKEGLKKDFNFAHQCRETGNKYFIKREYKDSLEIYNKGIMQCPQETDAEKGLYCCLIANRSAALFELKEYEIVLKDINYVLSLNTYPKKLLYKILLRKARCCQALDLPYDFNICFEYMKKYNTFDDITVEIQTERMSKLSGQKLTVLQPQLITSTLTKKFKRDRVWVNANKNIRFEEKEGLGKYAVAKADFNVGDIIVKEDAFCISLLGKNAANNCQVCCRSIINPIPCPKCCHVVFCTDPECYNANFHKYECEIIYTLYRIDVSVNCLMALRMITQYSLSFFLERQEYIKMHLNDDCPPDKNIYKPWNYLSAFNLCGNNAAINSGQYVYFSTMALYVVNLLKYGNYFFGSESKEHELFIAAIFVHHLNILQFNSHEISEMKILYETVIKDTNFKNKSIAGGLFTTVARFNHACDPSIIRYNIGKTMIVEAIKPIKAGEPIYENYGPLYTEKIKAERREILLKRYLFECKCRPCIENWPTLGILMDNGNDNPGFTLKCKTANCSYGYNCSFSTIVLFFKCKVCHKKNNVFSPLLKLAKMSTTTPIAAKYFISGDFKNAEKLYRELLTILYEEVKMPCIDALTLQQRLKNMAVMKGNKVFEFLCNQI